jgi:stearoyl-CoA desaturase (Delta-9 desaturase)
MTSYESDATPSWLRTCLLALMHVLAVATVALALVQPPALATAALAGAWYLCSGFAITGGYHRLYAHKSYRCSPLVSTFFLLFGAAAVQNSAVVWASDHRRHHAHTDEDGDPYDARRGFWWSHIGWMLRVEDAPDYSNVRDLLADPLVRLQHQFYPLLAVAMAGVAPGLVATAWGDPVGGVLWGGIVRLVAQYHATFAVNSVAHRFGRRPYSRSTSARDNALVALLAMGEGYHNFHHRFPSDYRNGVRWFDYDPTKWLVGTLATIGLASDLKRVSPVAIEEARLERSRSD